MPVQDGVSRSAGIKIVLGGYRAAPRRRVEGSRGMQQDRAPRRLRHLSRFHLERGLASACGRIRPTLGSRINSRRPSPRAARLRRPTAPPRSARHLGNASFTTLDRISLLCRRRKSCRHFRWDLLLRADKLPARQSSPVAT